MNRKVLKVIDGETVFPPPIWMMRQAGRYLPEYRETRKKAGSFLDLCYSPDLAVEVTLQPIRRFGFDAAILFSDILVVPHALGRDLRFEEGKGPLMTPIDADEIFWLETEGVAKRLEPVYETVRLVREQLPDETTLLGFCGAPWTVATYMIAGHGTPDQAPARLFAYRFPEAFEKLLNDLADVSAEYLIEQLGAGADAVQIFDSWSGVLDEDCFERFCIRPVARIVQKVRAVYPQARIIGFPKGAGMLYAGYREKTGVDMLGLDWSVPLSFAALLQEEGAVQGNLDLLRVVAGGNALDEGVDAILERMGQGPLVFNLGHGITPQAPIENVQRMIDRVRGGKS
ncbi:MULTISPECIES: uroporphyrinogen decarboxylase [Brucella]|uniref:uroporphyrinogen decarboxylase n=2 Tax=Brucella/Ochrobactrum group TaxID=2826938 RepID=UPI0001B59797|nr:MULTISPECIES: uroporphyrinogen decarboxylase [Brucella]EEZ07534.1 uroporphyrinogen decarboxylase [Brucella ceti M490/95/1]ENT07375.1 uroporphyrinogen decarboxylase [Brucella sp. F23/97]ENT18505.1 uroporphyrinogen decarboxylase [Brucella sp. F96/2]ENT20447.1 uroporphyrinogen decarboxylase [Brucella sp. UK1/97]KEY02428.1 uroporphyrinogen decarboxylase [Brucella ceti B1/94]